jgi:soluble cytochrome b562
LGFKVYVAAAFVAAAGTLAVAQKMTTEDELDKAMKRVQPAMMAANKALQAKNFDEAGKQLGVVRQVMEETREFWVFHKRQDAIKANTETVAAIDGTQKLIQSGDQPAAQAALKELGAACRTCHEVYRARDADNNWILKPGSLN